MRRGRVPELGILLLALQIFRNVGVTNIPPVTFLLILLQVAVYMQLLVVPRLCLSGEGVWQHGEYLQLLIPAIRHGHDIHLYYNMVSLIWKGIALERRLGPVKYLLTVLCLTLLSSAAYVALAILASDLLEDYSYMRQCAVGFSGVLFAMKVLTTNYENAGDEEASYFGFLVPVRWAVWAELLLIQLVVPNASFIGHLGGILAGLLYLHGPLGALLSVAGTLSPFRWLSGNFGTWLVSGGLTYLHTVYRPPFKGCVPNSSIFWNGWESLATPDLLSLLLAPLYHQGLLHLAMNLVSLHVKSWRLEGSLGTLAYLTTLAQAVIATSLVRLVGVRVIGELTGYHARVDPCIVGLSGPLFALKVLVILGSHSVDLPLLYELVELFVLYEKNSRLYHLSGLVAGVLIYVWNSRRTTTYPGQGLRLGGGGRDTGGHQPYPPPPATRSWGYGPQGDAQPPADHDNATDYSWEEAADPELAEAIRQSEASYRAETGSQRYTPSAPRYDDIEEAEGDVVYPDLVGERPPLYAANPGPPPRGGWRLPDQARGLSTEELRRRRIERFS